MSRAILEVHDWHTECTACGYGSGSWPGAFRGKDIPILTPGSKECPGCKVKFTHTRTISSYVSPELKEIDKEILNDA
jgi:hypothetical protein